jgi:hypothetical protein
LLLATPCGAHSKRVRINYGHIITNLKTRVFELVTAQNKCAKRGVFKTFGASKTKLYDYRINWDTFIHGSIKHNAKYPSDETLGKLFQMAIVVNCSLPCWFSVGGYLSKLLQRLPTSTCTANSQLKVQRKTI